jgi:hypothetical protein
MADDITGASNAGAAAAAVDFLAQLVKIGIGIEFASEPRVGGGIGNGEIIRIHAVEGVKRNDIGVVKRSIYPNEQQVYKAGEAFAAAVAKHLSRIGQEYTRRIGPGAGMEGPKQQITGTYTEEKQVKQAGASALKAAAVVYHDDMKLNLDSMKNTDGTSMQSVKDNYALRRLSEHMVSPSAIMQATGQLESAFEAGKYTLYYKPGEMTADKLRSVKP